MREEVGLRCRIYGGGGLGGEIVYILHELKLYFEANERLSTAVLTGDNLLGYYVLPFPPNNTSLCAYPA